MCDQARAIRKNSWLSNLELGNIWRVIEAKRIEDIEKQIERDIARASEKNEQIGDDSDETINNVTANIETLDKEIKIIIAQVAETLMLFLLRSWYEHYNFLKQRRTG